MNSEIISIAVPPFPNYIEGGYRTLKKDESHVDRTNLGYFVLIIMEKGCLFLEEDGCRYEIHEREMFILLPDKHHCSWKPCEEETGYYWMHIYTSAPWKQGMGADTFEATLPISELYFYQRPHTLHLSKHLTINKPEVLIELFNNILNSTVKSEENNIWKTQELFFEFLRFAENMGIYMDRKTLLAEQIRIYLEKNISQPVTNESLEDRFHLHKNYLIKIMKAIYGMTPLELLLEMRINHAKHYLTSTNHTIQEISEMVGFSSDIYFSNCFKKYIGISPRNYRKKYEREYI